MDAVPAARFGGRAGRQREVLVLRDVRGDVRTQRDGEAALLALVAKLDHDDAGAVALGHELAVLTVRIEELLRDGNYLQPLPLPTKRGSHRCEPLTGG